MQRMARGDAGRVSTDERPGINPEPVSTPMQYRDTCGKCGAVRQDRQLGLEPTPEAYVANMVAVFRAVRRVLRDDGTLWLVLGDSYASGSGLGRNDAGRDFTGGGGNKLGSGNPGRQGNHERRTGLKPKDLVGIPWAVARALQAPYYTGRIPRERDRVWLAAMVDAEGTICGFDHDRADGNGHRSGVHMTITNTSTAILDEAARIWPASRSEHQRPRAGHLGTMQTWRWIVHGIENKMAAIRDIYPHLIAKRQQAVVGYTLLDLMANAKRLGHSPQKDAVIAKRRVLTGLLSDLNHQRPVTLPDWLVEPPSTFEPGWYLRSDIIWAKPNPMPESVTDRPTKSHEYLFLLTKRATYWYDADAVREAYTDSNESRLDAIRSHGTATGPVVTKRDTPHAMQNDSRGLPGVGTTFGTFNPAGRNRRTVWTVATQPYPGAHFAVMPEALVEPCVLAGCPDQTCSECGAPWTRVVERTNATSGRAPGSTWQSRTNPRFARGGAFTGATSETTGWRPTCAHDAPTVPGVVLDPFGGSGTVARVANRLSRRAVLIDLNPDYLAQQLGRNAQTPLGLAG